MAGRFPDARNVRELWQNIAAGVCSVRHFTPEELARSGVSPAEMAQENYIPAGTVLQDMDLFDAAFFGFTPRDAEIMDPQQRFLLECSVEALETAGYPNERYAGKIGVFVGKGTSLYLLEHLLYYPEIFQQLGMMPVLNVNEKDHAATLVSYKLNLTGPGVNVNTTCSTSLVAIHTACQSLLNEECAIALAGGVSFVSTQERGGYLYYEGGIFSSDGLCRAFSDDANGSIFGSGAGSVLVGHFHGRLRECRLRKCMRILRCGIVCSLGRALASGLRQLIQLRAVLLVECLFERSLGERGRHTKCEGEETAHSFATFLCTR
jgi:acyl transferase domain-containing protein